MQPDDLSASLDARADSPEQGRPMARRGEPRDELRELLERRALDRLRRELAVALEIEVTLRARHVRLPDGWGDDLLGGLRQLGVPPEDLAQVDAILHPERERSGANRPVRPSRSVCARARLRARARSSCGGRRRPGRRVARAHAPASDGEGEPEPGDARRATDDRQGALA